MVTEIYINIPKALRPKPKKKKKRKENTEKQNSNSRSSSTKHAINVIIHHKTLACTATTGKKDKRVEGIGMAHKVQ